MDIRFVWLLPVFLTACTTAQTAGLSRDDRLALTTHTYTNRSSEQVIKAAEAVIAQPAPALVKIFDKENGFVATKPYLIYAVIAAESGTYTWLFQATKKDPKSLAVSANIALSRARTGTSAAVIGSNVVAMSSTDYGQLINSPFTYRLFWERVDYVLGLRDDWPACEGRRPNMVNANDDAGPSLFGLCSLVGGEPPPPARVI